jgi:hypothetical protein
MAISPGDDSDKIKETAQKADEILKSLEESGAPATVSGGEPAPAPQKARNNPAPRIVSLAGLIAVILAIGIQIGVRTGQDLAKDSDGRSGREEAIEGDSTNGSQLPPKNPPVKAQEAPTKPKEQLPELTEQPSECGEWGCASDYKFGRIPDREYPNSCAFSLTDSGGLRILSKSRIEFWACRDEGGDASNGYKIAWSDGKSTRYTFGPGGQGLIVGLDERSYPITWRNSTHNRTNIIIINHEDGAESWIPGSVNL